MKLSYPGIGGSLGECVICGECFAVEILMGRSISMVEIPGFDRQMPLHGKCLEKMESLRGESWESLPEGPLRAAYAEHFANGVCTYGGCKLSMGHVGAHSQERDEDDTRFAKDRDEWKHEAAEQQRLK